MARTPRAARCMAPWSAGSARLPPTCGFIPGSMYPYAPIPFDYIRRTMPMTAPQSLTNDQVYGLAAYIPNLNGLLPDDAVMDAASLPKVAMPIEMTSYWASAPIRRPGGASAIVRRPYAPSRGVAAIRICKQFNVLNLRPYRSARPHPLRPADRMDARQRDHASRRRPVR